MKALILFHLRFGLTSLIRLFLRVKVRISFAFDINDVFLWQLIDFAKLFLFVDDNLNFINRCGPLTLRYLWFWIRFIFLNDVIVLVHDLNHFSDCTSTNLQLNF